MISDAQEDIARMLAQSNVDLGIDATRIDVSKLATLPRSILGKLAGASKEFLRAVCLADPPSESSLVNPELPSLIENAGFTYGTLYVKAMSKLIEANDEWLSSGLIHPNLLGLIEKKREDLEFYVTDPDELGFYRTQGMLAHAVSQLLAAWWMAVLIRYGDRSRGASLIAEARADAMNSASILSDLRFVFSRDAPELATLLDQVTSETLSGLADAMRSESGTVNLADRGYDALRLEDLSRLAHRESAVRESYNMSLERAFERQLSLLFTSFGMAVIESTPGRRYVDLVCIGSDPIPQTLVVEAKSTSRLAYEFPASDQRALVEHVEEVMNTLRGLPKVELVLLVAPHFSPGAEKRLADVQRTLHVPCRGITAGVLIDLRRKHIGPISSSMVIDELQSSDVIVKDDIVGAIISRNTATTRGWQEWVNIVRQANVKSR